MPVAAIKPYTGEVKDSVDKFHGTQLLYIGWEDHLMFCAPFAIPFPPAMRFGDIIDQVLPTAFGAHPDFEKIDWSKAEWLKSGKPWTVDFKQSLSGNGLKHKDVLRFRTPGLTGIKGSCS
ncbi:MAG TPA: phenol hydroxylase [Oxalobacteraceae bacterium]|nr:phenol hydroxylase [Oxalobacteraceae bacterium]